jgi:lipid II:glycine glycyltransferase (peptidoglycan interpeptide bridge formation enzyme)
VVRAENEIASAGIFSETCGIVQYRLSGTADAYRQNDASHLMTHFAREWARERGNTVFHLGDGVGAANDSLFQFKAAYSKHRSQFSTWRVIIDQQVYRDLLQSRQIEVDWQHAGSGKFFAEYRVCAPSDK